LLRGPDKNKAEIDPYGLFHCPSKVLKLLFMLMTNSPSATPTNSVEQRVEPRKLERFSLRLRASVSGLEAGSRTLNLVTENISAGGAFFPTGKPLPEGLAVSVELTLKRESGKGNGSKVRLKGTVLPPRPHGMALVFGKRVQFLPC
jgi:hypothetical protein